MSGFVKVHRALFEHPFFQNDIEKIGAWVWLIANACWQPTQVRIGREIVELDRGEMSFSVRFLAEKWGWSKSRVNRFIADLRAHGMVKTRSKSGTEAGQFAKRHTGQRQSIITICNYSTYQDLDSTAWDSLRDSDEKKAGQRIRKEERKNIYIHQKSPASETDFLIWWKAYPRKVGKQAALKAWRSAIKRGATVEQLLKAAERYAANPPDDPRYIPHPTTWLNQGRYEDEPHQLEEEWRPPW